MSTKAPKELLVVVGQDDGHETHKTCFGWDKETNTYQYGYTKSRAVDGWQQVMSVGSETGTGGAYETDGQRFTVAGQQSLLRTIDTRMDGYASSHLNRTLVNHSLAACGLGNKSIYLVTGLPVDQYYKNGIPNQELIGQKIESLSKPVTRMGKGPDLPIIVKQGVISEAIAAFYDSLIQPDGTYNKEIETLIARRPVAVIDLGGKTLDIVVVAENVSSVYSDKSGTANIGVLHLIDKVADRIKSEFDFNSNPPIPFVEEACRTKKYDVFGNQVDVTHIIEAACTDYLTQVRSYFVSKVGDGSDLGAVLFVGGGTALIRSVLGEDAFASIYKGKRIIAVQPEYANARGMWKYGMFILSASELEVDAVVAA